MSDWLVFVCFKQYYHVAELLINVINNKEPILCMVSAVVVLKKKGFAQNVVLRLTQLRLFRFIVNCMSVIRIVIVFIKIICKEMKSLFLSIFENGFTKGKK